MLKKFLFLIVLFLNISYFCNSQPQEGKYKRAETVLEDYITKELSLTPDELQRLKPVYKSYFLEIRSARKDNNGDPIAVDEKILGIRKKYKEDFKKILGSEERVNKLLIAEKNFRDILRKELIQRRMNRQGMQR